MKAVLLAAGRSKRLKPIEDKNFLCFLGKPLLQWQIEELIQAGLKDLIVVGGRHNLEKIKDLIKGILAAASGSVAGSVGGLRIVVVEQKDLDEGMAGALLAAEKLIMDYSVFVVSANDIVDQEAYKLILGAANGRGAGAAGGTDMTARDGGLAKFDGFLIGKKVKEYFPGGYLKVAKNGLITGIVEKPGAGKEPSDFINLVLHFHRDGGKLLEFVKKTKSARDDRYEMAMDAMIKSGCRLKVVPYNGFWQAIKYPWHVINVMNRFLESWPAWAGSKHIDGWNGHKKISKKALVAKSAVIKGNVFIDDGVIVEENAVIIGPAYIGKNVIISSSAKIRSNVYLDEAVIVSENVLIRSSYVGKSSIIGNNALVRGSHIGANCVIGFGTEVARSYVGSNVWTHTNYIGDSIIGDNCSFGAGTVTGNLRLDEKNISVNINTGKPGTSEKIDSGCNKFGLVTGSGLRCGINTSFMPGIKIGNNCFIGAGITVAQDIEDNKFVYGRTELVIKENKAKLNAEKRAQMKGKL